MSIERVFQEEPSADPSVFFEHISKGQGCSSVGLFMALLVVFYPRSPLKVQLLEALMEHLAVHTSRKRNGSNDECVVMSVHNVVLVHGLDCYKPRWFILIPMLPGQFLLLYR